MAASAMSGPRRARRRSCWDSSQARMSDGTLKDREHIHMRWQTVSQLPAMRRYVAERREEWCLICGFCSQDPMEQTRQATNSKQLSRLLFDVAIEMVVSCVYSCYAVTSSRHMRQFWRRLWRLVIILRILAFTIKHA